MLLVAALIVMICVCLFSLVAIQRSMNIKNLGLLISDIKSQMADRKSHKWTEEERQEKLRREASRYGGCGGCGG